MHEVTITKKGNALSDLLLLFKSNILIVSKNTTFSMWASFLGGMPNIWPENSNVPSNQFSI